MPEGVDGSAFLKRLESRFGIKVAGGQGHLKGKIFRIAHMGIVDELDILGTLSAIELVLDGAGPAGRIGRRRGRRQPRAGRDTDGQPWAGAGWH